MCHHMSAEAFFGYLPKRVVLQPRQRCVFEAFLLSAVRIRSGPQIYHSLVGVTDQNVSQCLQGSAGAHMINNMSIFIYLFSAGKKTKRIWALHVETAGGGKIKAGTWKGRETTVTGSMFCFCARRTFSSQWPPACDPRSSSAKSESINYLNKGSWHGTF